MRSSFSPRLIRTEVSRFQLRHKLHNRGDQRILCRFARIRASDTETLAAEVLGEPSPQVGEGVFGALAGGIAPWRCLLQMGAIDPGDRS